MWKRGGPSEADITKRHFRLTQKERGIKYTIALYNLKQVILE